jgi:hypothetical protein
MEQIWVLVTTTPIIPIFIGTLTILLIGEQAFIWDTISGGVRLGDTIRISTRPTIIRIITDHIIRAITVRTIIIRTHITIAEIIITTVLIETATTITITDTAIQCREALQA